MSTLVKRTLSGTVYVALLLGCVLWCKYSFMAVFVFFEIIMMLEFLRMTMGEEFKRSRALAIVTGAAFFILVWAVRAFPTIKAEFCFLAFLPLIFIMINSLYVKDKGDFGKFANVYTSLLYIAFPLSSINFLVIDEVGNYINNGVILVAFFVIIWCSDIGAYIFGMAFGQKFGKKLFPSISPKKSWVGFWGGFALAILASLVLNWTGVWEISGIKNMTWYHAILLAACMNVAGVYGDLFESQWKRHYELKDSGKIIPGHGGMLDRLDSALFAIPVGMIYLFLFKFIEISIS